MGTTRYVVLRRKTAKDFIEANECNRDHNPAAA